MTPQDRSLKQIGKLFLSRKLWMSLLASGVLYCSYWDMIKYLYTFQEPTQIVAFQALSTNYFWAITVIWLGYLGINGVTTWANSSSSMASLAAESVSQKIESTNTEINLSPKEVDDGSID